MTVSLRITKAIGKINVRIIGSQTTIGRSINSRKTFNFTKLAIKKGDITISKT